MLASHDPRVRLPGQVQVVGVAAFAAQEHRIFGARDRLADAMAAGRRFSRISHRGDYCVLYSGANGVPANVFLQAG
jgi:hypothetical protein